VKNLATILLAFSIVIVNSSGNFASDCGCKFIRGDADHGGQVDMSDAVLILNYLFYGYPICNFDAADSTDNGIITMDDSYYILCFLYGGTNCPPNPPPPPAPFPSEGCDCTPDNLEKCCSRSFGASDPEPLSINSAACNPPQGSGNNWDIRTCTSGTTSVNITTQNGNSCAHADSSVFWNVEWAISDPHGVENSALNEAISPATSPNYSVKLTKIEYDWCNP
jgi:hypothetical protein